MLKKSYRGFVIWMIGFTAACMGVPFLFPAEMDAMVAMRIVCNVMNVAVTILMLMIYLNEKVFWFSGITYEQAVEAGCGRRKSYALKHLKLFGVFTAVILFFSIVAQLLKISAWVDLILTCVGLTVCAFYSNRYKL